jgi:hypothetical protein
MGLGGTTPRSKAHDTHLSQDVYMGCPIQTQKRDLKRESVTDREGSRLSSGARLIKKGMDTLPPNHICFLSVACGMGEKMTREARQQQRRKNCKPLLLPHLTATSSRLFLLQRPSSPSAMVHVHACSRQGL